MASPVSVVHAHWHYLFDKVQYSAQEFYALTEAAIASREITGVTMSRVTLSEGNLLSAGREYLRVKGNEYIFDICASPFGNGFFVSWWLGEAEGCNLLQRIPLFGRFFRVTKTYYRLDIETMFKESIHTSVQEAVEQLATAKGFRTLTAEEKKLKDLI